MVLQDWVPEVVATFTTKFAARHQTCQLDISPDLPPLTTDLFILHRILVELLTNASKFTPNHEHIQLSLQPIVDDSDRAIEPQRLQIHIRNTGIEIPPHELQNVFDQFYRLPSCDPWKHGGTGLGLALVKKLVLHLGGTIRVESASGATCFIIELPLSPANHSLSNAAVS